MPNEFIRDSVIVNAMEEEHKGNWNISISLIVDGMKNFKGINKLDALLQLGKIYKYIGEYNKSIKVLESITSEERNKMFYPLIEQASLQIAIVNLYLGNIYSAINSITTLFDKTSDPYIKSHCLLQLGISNRILWNLKDALNYLLESQMMKRKINNPRDRAAVIEQIGIVFERQNLYERAYEMYYESYLLKKECQYERGVATSFLRFAVNRFATGNRMNSKTDFLLSLNMRKKSNDLIGLGSCYYELAKSELKNKNYNRSGTLLKASLLYREKINDPRRIANAIYLGGILYHNLNRNQNSIALLIHAYNIYREIGLKVESVNILMYLVDHFEKNELCYINKEIIKTNEYLSELTPEQMSYMSKINN